MEKGFASGLRRFRIKVLNRVEAEMGAFGLDSAELEWQESGEVWADVNWTKGKAAMSAGALDAYAVKMVRMNWNDYTNERSRIVWEGKTFQILPDTFHASHYDNTIQFHAQLLVNENVAETEEANETPTTK